MAYIENPQSVQQYINNINESKNIIANKVVEELGLAAEGANLKTLAAAIDGIVKRTPDIDIKQGEEVTFEAGYYDTFRVTGLNDPSLDVQFLESKTVNPTESTQVIKPTEGSTYYGLSQVTVNAINKNAKLTEWTTPAEGETAATAAGMLDDTVAWVNGTKVAGTMVNHENEFIKITPGDKGPSTGSYAVSIEEGYYNGESIAWIDAASCSPAYNPAGETINATTGGKFFDKVIIPAVPDTGIATSQVLASKTYYNNGALLTGTMPNYSGTNKTCNLENVDGMTDPNWEENFTSGDLQYSLSPGYYTGKIYVPAVKADLTTNPDAYDSMELYKGKYLTRPDGESFLLGVTIPAVPNTGIDKMKILDGEVAYANGQKIEGEMSNNGSATSTVTADLADTDGKVTKDISTGYYSGGTITFDYSNILTELAKI